MSETTQPSRRLPGGWQERVIAALDLQQYRDFQPLQDLLDAFENIEGDLLSKTTTRRSARHKHRRRSDEELDEELRVLVAAGLTASDMDKVRRTSSSVQTSAR
jgi:hypothetical protein